MNKKSKKGSALITVLIFSLLFIVISGVSALAVVNTMRGNSGEERYQTLYYEAEAGVEKAFANANNGVYDTLAVSSTSSFTINDSEMFGEVNVSVTKHTDSASKEYLQVISTSTAPSGQSRTVKVKIRKYIYANDIFRYSICGEKVLVDGNGSINLNPSLINSSDTEAIVGPSGATVDSSSETNESFELPIFDDTKIPHSTYWEINCTSNNLKNKLNLMSDDITQPIRKVSIASPSFDVYLINADKVKINTDGFNEVNMMILCSGDLEFNLAKQGQLTSSSLIAKSVTVGNANLQISYRPYDQKFKEGDSVPHEPLRKNHIENLMDGYIDSNGNFVNGISYYAPNFGYGGDPAGEDLSGNVSDYE